MSKRDRTMSLFIKSGACIDRANLILCEYIIPPFSINTFLELEEEPKSGPSHVQELLLSIKMRARAMMIKQKVLITYRSFLYQTLDSFLTSMAILENE